MLNHMGSPQLLDDLPAMAVFACVVEARSFTAASRILGTTTSSVSKRVAHLEERLGVRLLARTTRSLSPTEAGLTFYDRCARILRDVNDAELAMTELGGTPRGTLRVTAMTLFGEVHLAPLTAAFLAEYPQLRIELDLDDRLVNLVAEGYDLAIRGTRHGTRADSSLVAKRLVTDGSIVICGAPSYFARRGVPREPEDLVDHECLHYNLIPLQTEWSFETPEGPRVVPVTSRAQFNSANALRAAGIAGAGLFRTSLMSVVEALRTGALQAVLPEYALTDLSLYAMYPSGKHPSPKVKAYVDFLLRELPQRLA